MADATYKQFDLVYIEWIDSATPDTGWKILENWTFGTVKCQSIGWMLESTDEHITLVSSVGRNEGDFESQPNQALGVISIPTVAILRMRPLLVHEGSRG